ncbi:MAG TPA: hypothetical protein VHE10_02945 [Candidatus Paceibacterota bacterium]|nr:hypothetical protein [Candidatus Paceibacterota bacterium]
MKTLRIALFLALLFPAFAFAAGGGIDPSYPYAWSEKAGWLNFGTNEGNAQVTDSKLTGYVWSENLGWISLAPTGSTYVANDAHGDLSGYAWGESSGYIDFSNATIDSQGFFHGYANSSVTGQISLNCDNTSSCGSSDFKVKTYWQPAATPPATPPTTPTGGGGGTGTKSDVPNLQNAPQNNPSNPGLSSGVLAAPTTIILPTAAPPEALAAATVLAKRGIGEPTAASIPRFLFDITLAIDPDHIDVGDDLVSRVTFTNFGTDRTPATMLFSIKDESGATRRTETATTSVETQIVYNKRMTELGLEPGSYWLTLDVTYGTSSRETLNARFNVVGTGMMCGLWWPFEWLVDHVAILAWFGCRLPWYLLIAAIISAITWFIHRYYGLAAVKRRNQKKKYENW